MSAVNRPGQPAVWPNCLTISRRDLDLGEKPKGTLFTAEFRVNSSSTCRQTYYISVPKPAGVSWIDSISITPSNELDINGSVTVTILGKYPDSDFTTNLTVSATPNGGTQTVTVHGKVAPPPPPPSPPDLEVDKTEIDLGIQPAGTPFEKKFNVRNKGGGTLRVYITTNKGWLSTSPTDFNLGQGQSQSVTISGHFPSSDSDFPATITLTSNGGEERVRVDGSVAEARLQVSPMEIDLGKAIPDTPFDKVLTVKNVGGGTLVGSVQSNLDWIEVNPSDFEVTSGAVAYIGISGRFPSTIGPIDTRIAVASNGGNLVIPVHGEVTVPDVQGYIVKGKITLVGDDVIRGPDGSPRYGKCGMRARLVGITDESFVREGTTYDNGEYRFELNRDQYGEYRITPFRPDYYTFEPTSQAVVTSEPEIIRDFLAVSTLLQGIDVSRSQGDIAWEEVRNQNSYVKFAFVKKSDGWWFYIDDKGKKIYQDPEFPNNWKGTKDYGITHGAYHFFRAKEPVDRQATDFVAGLRLGPEDLPPVLDIEFYSWLKNTAECNKSPYPSVDEHPECYYSPTKLDIDNIMTWLQRVATHTKRTPIIYASAGVGDWLLSKLGQKFFQDPKYEIITRSPLWVASYYFVDPNRNFIYPAEPTLPGDASKNIKIWDNWFFWQYTDRGCVKGTKRGDECLDGEGNGANKVDRDYFKGSLEDLHQFIRDSVQEAFTDVPADHWAKPWIEKAYGQGTMTEYGFYPFRFGPEEPVLRQDAAKLVFKAKYGKDYEPPAATGTVFNDVPKDHPLASWIEKSYADGFLSGCSTDPPLFCPGQNLTRAETALLKVRLAHGTAFTPPPATGTVFQDVPVTHWAAKWIEQLHRDGVAVGSSTNPPLYRPDEPVNRAEMAAFLMKPIEQRPGCGAVLQGFANILVKVTRRPDQPSQQHR